MPRTYKPRTTPKETPAAFDDLAVRIRFNGSSHVMLQLLKVMRKPMSLNELMAISPKKITYSSRRAVAESLVAAGYAARVAGGNRLDDKFVITERGVRKLYAMVIGRESR